MEYARMTIDYLDIQMGVPLPDGVEIVDIVQTPEGRISKEVELILASASHAGFCNVSGDLPIPRIFKENL